MSQGAPPASRDPVSDGDDSVAAFQIDGRPVRGRIVRLGAVIDDILGAHDHREPVARLLGEAIALTVLLGASLKIDGRLIVQAQGDGPVPLLVADYDSSGAVRGYARAVDETLDGLLRDTPRPRADQLIGAGHFAMTIDQGPHFDRYQSLVPLDGESFADMAGRYYQQSEQVPTRIRLAVAQVQTPGEDPRWRAGGAVLQQIAGDDVRGDTQQDWERARTLFETLTDDELVDPGISASTVLFRLFHEDGVRMHPPLCISKRCTCSQERVASVIGGFPEKEVRAMAEADGKVRVTCEYCNKDFILDAAAVASGPPEAG